MDNNQSTGNNLLEELQALLKHKKSRQYYAEKLGISINEVEDLITEIRERQRISINSNTNNGDDMPDLSLSSPGVIDQMDDIDQGIKTVRFNSTLEVMSDDQIFKECKLDPKKWKLSQIWQKKKLYGFVYSANFKKIDENQDVQFQKDKIIEEMKRYAPKYDKITYLPKTDPLLLEISVPDLHIGKLAHAAETGEDYDLKIAVKRFHDAIGEMLSRINRNQIERILFPIGNDLVHVDNEELTTTAGTPQDCDSRFSKMVKVTKDLLIGTITDLSRIAKVDVLTVKGNHDATITLLLAEIIDAFFHNSPNVSVDGSPKWRKYYQYYDNSFMYTHGDKEKHGELGLLFASEMPKLWADTKHRFVKLGHFHKSKRIDYMTTDTYSGFQVQVLPSLSGTDEWHYSKGYIGNKQAKAFLYHPTKGEIAQFTYTV